MAASVRTRVSVDDLAAGVRAGDLALLGRAITLVESNRPDHRRQAQDLLARLLPHTGAAHRIGLSGVPGAGKSTFIESFGCRLVDQGHRVAVLAVDPSSSRSKGSILGDKTRMERLTGRADAFIRPSPSGGSLGGVGRKTRETILVCEAAGFDVILIETVGVGQSETLVAEMVDVFVVLMLAGAGDELQGIKRGILELADILAINKADGDRAAAAQRARVETERALSILRPPGHEPWSPRVVTCSALEEIGLEAIWDLVEEHRAAMESEGLLDARRRRQQLEWMWAMVDEQLRTSVREHPRVSGLLGSLENGVLTGTVTPTHAALEILSAFLGRP
jgi:LAO/AO transport system kinase